MLIVKRTLLASLLFPKTEVTRKAEIILANHHSQHVHKRTKRNIKIADHTCRHLTGRPSHPQSSHHHRLSSSHNNPKPKLIQSPLFLSLLLASEMVGSDGSRRAGRCVGRRGPIMWGSATTIGRRTEMEDAVAVAPEFLDCSCEGIGGCRALPVNSTVSSVKFFGVYDGHGGAEVAAYCARRMHEVVVEKWSSQDGADGWKRRWEVAFVDAFDCLDNEIIAEDVASEAVGSTAVVAVVSDCQIIVSNCGDSRAVLCRGNETIQLTIDHKPDDGEELARIEALGGKVINWRGARVLGVLTMSRAIGDRYMRPYIIPVPETSFTPRTEQDDCLILASDGLWDVLSNEQVGDVASRLLRHQRRNGVVGESQTPAQVVADHLIRLAINTNSSDNISVTVVDLKSRDRRQTRRNSRHVSTSSTE